MKKRWLSVGIVGVLSGAIGIVIVGGCSSDPPIAVDGRDRSERDAGEKLPSGGSDASGDDDEEPTENPPTGDSGAVSTDRGTISCGTADCNTPSQICCATIAADGGFSGTCQAAGSNCKIGLVAVACDEPSDCNSGQRCCSAFSGLGTSCAASCILQSAPVCKVSQDCPDAGTCKDYDCFGRPFRACARPLGCD